MAIFFRRPRRMEFIPFLIVFVVAIYFVWYNLYQIKNAVSYATRPLWDKADGPSQIIPHYYSEGMPIDQQACIIHGWNRRGDTNNVKIIDAVLMSSELDLLEIRMEELDSVVDHFLILESNATFTSLSKPTFFASNRARFARFDHKIVYRFLHSNELQHPDPWKNEAKHRDTMTALIRETVGSLPSNIQPLVIMADVDEIPSEHTLRLLKQCDFGRSVHLQLRNYIYSFEWFIGMGSWRASVHEWQQRTSFYRHSKSGEVALADSGWHCSYCFRSIPEYVNKMKGFSHSDRIGGRINLLEPKRIQDVICKGRDIFGMLPEAYRYADLLSQMSLEAQTTAVGLPRFLLMNASRFKFLLPGGCKREE